MFDDLQPNAVRVATCVVLAVAVLAVEPADAEAGPWVKEPGQTYLKLSGELFSSNTTFDVDGKAMEAMPAYSHVGARMYAEVGVVPRISLGWSLPFISATNRLDDGRTFERVGLGDLDLRANVQIVRGVCSLAGQVKGRIPLYDDRVQAGDQATAAMQGSGDSQYEPILGDGSRELTPSLAFGCGFELPGWVTASAGPNVRFDGFGDGIEWSAGGGLYAIPDLFAIQFGVSGLERFTANDPRPTKRFVKGRAGLLVEFTDILALEGGVGYTIDGAFVARGWSGSLGVSYQGRIFPNPF